MKKLAIFFILILIVVFMSTIWWNNMLLAINPKNNTPTVFVVNQGDGVREIAYNLSSKGLVRNPIAFFLLIRKLGLDKKSRQEILGLIAQ